MKLSRRTRLATAAAAALTAALLLLLPAAAGASTRALGAGTATFVLDPDQTGTLITNGTPPYAMSPARLAFGASVIRLTMPIRGGTWSPSGLHGTFLLRGGLVFVEPSTPTWKKLRLTSWRAGVNNSSGFSILVNGSRHAGFFEENLMGSEPSIVTIKGHKYVKVTNVLLFFDATSVNAFTGAFGSGPADSAPFGAVTFVARLK